jgi:hypothetical protein
MNTIRILIPAFILMLLLVVPLSASPDNLPGTQQITIKSEYTGNAVVNEVTSLKWSTGTPGNMTTYTWQQAANLDKPGQSSYTQLDIERTNQSTTWQLKRGGSILPGGVTLDDRSIIQPQYLTGSFQSPLPSLPLFQPQQGFLYAPFTIPSLHTPFPYF